MTRVPTPLLAGVLAALAAGCPKPTPAPAPGPSAATGEGAGPATRDLVFDDLEAIEVTAAVSVPDALAMPPFVKVVPRRARPLAAARATYARTKDETDALVLATVLWERAKQVPAQAAALRDEIATVLGEVHAAGQGGTLEEATLIDLAAAQVLRGEKAEAAARYAEHLAAYPQSQQRADVATWLAYLRLHAGDSHGAAKALDGIEPAKVEHHYVAAHVGFALGDGAAAVEHIALAANGWSDTATAPRIVADIHAMLGALGSVADAGALLDTVAPKNDAFAVDTLFAMAGAAADAGRFQVAIEALDGAVDRLGGGAQNPSLLLHARFSQGNYALGLGDPAGAADRFLEAVAAVQACQAHTPTQTAPACTQANMDAVPANLASVAQLLHTVYATTLDARYFEAAKRLYEAYLAYQPAPANVAEVRGYLQQLDETRVNAAAGAGTHDAERMNEVLALGKGRLTGCYAAALRREPGITGRVTATAEIDDDGTVSGVTTAPRGGKQGLAALAGCVEDALRKFRFPARTQPGKTVVVLPINFIP